VTNKIKTNTAKGDMKGSLAGRYSNMLRTAGTLAIDQPPPTIIIETQNHSTIVRDYDTLTVAMKVKREEGMEDV